MMEDQFNSLKQALPVGSVVLPGDDTYDELLQRWSVTCVKPAAVIVLPSTTDHVSTAITYANAHSIPFTACCGGHSTSGQSAAPSPEGMVIDLRRLRAISVDTSAKTISFGGGALWADVDAAAWAHGHLATVGGTVNHTGVGGLILGGGFGLLTPRRGLTIDVLLEVEVVLADGRVVVASEDQKADLFWALRGAGASFGIATRFTSRVFDQSRVWAGPLVFPADRIPDVVSAVNRVLEASWSSSNEEEECKSAVMLVLAYAPPPDVVPVVMALAFHDGPEADGKVAFAPLLDLGPLAVMAREMDYPEVNSLANPMLPHGARYQSGAANATFPLDADVVRAAADGFFEGVAALSADDSDVEDARGSLLMFECLPYAKVREVPPDAMAFANRGEYFNVAFMMKWKNPDNDGKVRELKQSLAALIRSRGFKGDDVGGDGVGQYNNYLETDISAEGAFGGNAQRLKELKAKYDPHNRFNKLWKLAA